MVRKVFRKKVKGVRKIADKEAKKMIRKYVGSVRKLRIPRGRNLDIFKSVWRGLVGSMTAETQVVSPATNIILAFKGNSFYAAGPAVANSGSFSANVPSGLYNLLSSNNAGGSTAPYSLARILASRITFEITSNAANTVGGKIVVWPSQGPTSSGMSFTQAREQRFAKSAYIANNTNAKEFRLSNEMSTCKFVGVAETRIEEAAFACSAIAQPANTWYWQAILQAADGSTAINYAISVKIDYLFDVYERNQLPTTVPT